MTTLSKIHFPTAQKMKFSIKDFFSKFDQVRHFQRIWSHLLKKSLMENFIFCAVSFVTEVIIFGHNLFMVSLDVESLLTNIPIDETIKNALDDMYQKKLSKSELYYL